MKPRNQLLGWGCVLVLMFLAFGCNEDSSADGNGGQEGAFGSTCAANADCNSGLCYPTATSKYCTVACTSDSECQTQLAGSCCNDMGYCELNCETTDGDASSDGDQITGCSQGAYRCSGNNVEECKDGQNWSFYHDCSADGLVCLEGACTTAGDGDQAVSDGDTDGEIAEGETCTIAGERKCVENTVWRCTEGEGGAKMWESYLECPSTDVCDAGQCRPILGETCEKDDDCGTGEYCFFKDSSSGYCTRSCGDGEDDPHCTRGYQCIHSKCEKIEGYCQKDGDCESGDFCDILPGAEDGMCRTYCTAVGVACENPLTKCIEDETSLNYGRCIPIDSSCEQCYDDSGCQPSNTTYCEKVAGQNVGCCRDKCSSANPCTEPLVCNSQGRCVVGSGKGDCGGPCPTGYVCDPVFNQCVLNCPQCPVNNCCDASSAPNCYECKCENPAVCGVLLPPCCAGYNCSAVVYGVLGYCQ